MKRQPATTKIWAQRISAAWQKTLAGVFRVGDLLVAAKKDLRKQGKHGEFEKMIEAELPFGSRTAERLMEIARDPRLRNPTHVSLLPRSWGTLYALTRLSDEEFNARIADGTIHADMTRQEIEAKKVIPLIVSTAQPQPAKMVAAVLSKPKQQQPQTLRLKVGNKPRVTPPLPEPSAARRQALCVLENLLLLEDEELADAVVDLLHEPTRGEQLFRLCEVLQSLGEAIKNHKGLAF